MKKGFILAVSLFCSLATANENKVINYSSESRSGQEQFFLTGTQEGSYTIKSWQFDMEKATWDGKGEPKLAIGKAIDQAYKYFNKTELELGVKEVEFKPAFSREGTIIWYYLVTLTTLPYKFNSDEFEIVVLLSGEILKANGK
ncbi:hypothetical protein I6F65_21200 [Pseudoalteromonas sp. SWXJZ94C]|uniref:hypothetical protein n=1 Tax=Pseudoalteromonas sp. SWXJZ94C TaxID=2792065 RepID=UPI0018CF478D|nr:hypothetical protein [Pseudoalteromonas sp. SWXJZ94C]MBH0059453.1 hypothetical protein [Pseudoalteromonas sp. SWXJZ94C]